MFGVFVGHLSNMCNIKDFIFYVIDHEKTNKTSFKVFNNKNEIQQA